MYRNAQQAYEDVKKSATSGREIEAEALFKAARMIESCQKAWDAPDRRAKLREALRLNMKLWTLFQSELTRNDHELPLDLRRDLLRISLFIDKRTYEVMARPQPEKLQALIDINRHIASGLATAPPQQKAA